MASRASRLLSIFRSAGISALSYATHFLFAYQLYELAD
jgi:hypothetical protein